MSASKQEMQKSPPETPSRQQSISNTLSPTTPKPKISDSQIEGFEKENPIPLSSLHSSSPGLESEPEPEPEDHDEVADEESADENEDEDEDEAEQIVDRKKMHPLPQFDWSAFEMEVEASIAQARQHETALANDFDTLVQYFKVWSQAAAYHDEDRLSKRLKTREVWVQNAERNVLAKRQKYEMIVDAFQKAYDLFGDP